MKVTQTPESKALIERKVNQIVVEAAMGKITLEEAKAQAIAFAQAHAEFELMPTDANHSPMGGTH